MNARDEERLHQRLVDGMADPGMHPECAEHVGMIDRGDEERERAFREAEREEAEELAARLAELSPLVAEDAAAGRVFAGSPRTALSGSPTWYRVVEVRAHAPKTVAEYRYADEWNRQWDARGGGAVEIAAVVIDGGHAIPKTAREYLADRARPYQQVGFFDFAVEDPEGQWKVERYVRRSPEAAAGELFRLRKQQQR